MVILLILLGIFGLGAFYQYCRVRKAEKERDDFLRGWLLEDKRIRQQDRDAQIQRALVCKEALTGPQHPLDVTNDLPDVFVMHSMVFNELLKRGQVNSYARLINTSYERTFCGVPIIIDDNQPRQTTWKDIIEASRSYNPIRPYHLGHKGDGARFSARQQPASSSSRRQEDDTVINVLLATTLVNSFTEHATSTDIPATQKDNFFGGGGEFGGGGASGSWDNSSSSSYDSGSSSSFDSGSGGGFDSGGGSFGSD